MFTNTTFGRTDLDTLKKQTKHKLRPVRVLDIILDSSHPEYEKYGREDSIGAIKYSYVESPTNPDPTANPIAFPLNSSVRQYPLKNEIVLLTLGTSSDISLETGSSKTLQKIYYTDIISIWNAANHNGINLEELPEIDLGYDFQESTNILPLQPYNGDTILQGRLGNSIRFSGSPHPRNDLQELSGTFAPNLLISIGHSETKNENGFKVEDLNQDKSSLYLLSDHKVDLEQSRVKYDSLKTKPTLGKEYLGSQLILNSDRIFLNTRKEGVYISTQEDFSVTSNNIGLDAIESIGLDSKKIYLGREALQREGQPVIKGDELENFLNTLLNTLETIGKSMEKAKTVDGKILPNMILNSKPVLANIDSLKTLINPGGQSRLKSKKVFTE